MSSALDDALTGFIALSKQAKAEGIDRMEDVAEVARGVREARAELAALRDELQDWRDGAAQAASERCGDDRHHCTCVPALRKRVGDLDLIARAALRHAQDGRALLPPIKGVRYMKPDGKVKDRPPFFLQGFGRLDDDGTGLPLLTPEARERIK